MILFDCKYIEHCHIIIQNIFQQRLRLKHKPINTYLLLTIDLWNSNWMFPIPPNISPTLKNPAEVSTPKLSQDIIGAQTGLILSFFINLSFVFCYSYFYLNTAMERPLSTMPYTLCALVVFLRGTNISHCILQFTTTTHNRSEGLRLIEYS